MANSLHKLMDCPDTTDELKKSVRFSTGSGLHIIGSIQTQLLPEDTDQDLLDFDVPPPTPTSDLSFNTPLISIPKEFSKLDQLQIPYIRDIGIKACLEQLSEYFGCNDYKVNPVQFWFLDILVDCLWRMQDEFQFPEQYQKIILEWILFLIELIRAPGMNFSRKKFFEVFTEAIVIAEEYIQTECKVLPAPSDLFYYASEIGPETSESWPSQSMESSIDNTPTLSDSETSDNGSYVAVDVNEDHEFFKLPQGPCVCDEFTSSSLDTASVHSNEYGQNFSEPAEISATTSSVGSMEFYKANSRTPSRFLSLNSASEKNTGDEIRGGGGEEEGEINVVPLGRDFMWKSSSSNFKTDSTSCSNYTPKQYNNKFNKTSGDIRNNNRSYDLLKRKSDDLINVPEDLTGEGVNFPGPKSSETKRLLERYLKDHRKYVIEGQKNAFINYCAIFAVKQFIYDYWKIPKIIKDELKIPKPKKEKKKEVKQQKQKKEKKKEKKPKEAKKDKKKDKTGKGSKKGKEKKLSKAEKAALAKLKKEEARSEEERRLNELRKRLLFPLSDAADDDFYKEIFDNWVKPKAKTKGGKANKKK